MRGYAELQSSDGELSDCGLTAIHLKVQVGRLPCHLDDE
jgi:hypothetical protein